MLRFHLVGDFNDFEYKVLKDKAKESTQMLFYIYNEI